MYSISDVGAAFVALRDGSDQSKLIVSPKLGDLVKGFFIRSVSYFLSKMLKC